MAGAKRFFERVPDNQPRDREGRVGSYTTKDLPGRFKVPMPHDQIKVKGPLRHADTGDVIIRERY